MDSFPKIIVTVGPGSNNLNTLNLMSKKGADCFRINLSHTKEKELDKIYNFFKNSKIKPCLDTQGAQLRASCNHKRKINIGEKVKVIEESDLSSKNEKENYIYINHWDDLIKSISVGTEIRIDSDGLVIKTIKINDTYVECEAISSGSINENRAADILNSKINLSPLTKLDKKACSHKIFQESDIIFISFVNKASDIQDFKKSYKKDLKIISKIETEMGVENFEEICKVSDGILIDRGDLSREISISNIPIIVNNLIKKANENNTPIYIATNVLDSMMNSPLPSRAEISDIYNLLEKGIQGLVLAAETAIGENPVQSVAVIQYMRLKNFHKNNDSENFKIIKSELLKDFPHLFYWL